MADIPHYLKAHLFIRITTNIKESSALQFLEKATRLYPGEHVVFVYHEADKRTYKLGERYSLANNQEMISYLQSYFGKENVVVDSLEKRCMNIVCIKYSVMLH